MRSESDARGLRQGPVGLETNTLLATNAVASPCWTKRSLKLAPASVMPAFARKMTDFCHPGWLRSAAAKTVDSWTAQSSSIGAIRADNFGPTAGNALFERASPAMYGGAQTRLCSPARVNTQDTQIVTVAQAK
jgi:hypothetical protein